MRLLNPTFANGKDVSLVELGLCFTSSSTVENFLALKLPMPAGLKTASIGPVTTLTARELGVTVAAEAKVFTVEGLVEAVLGLYTKAVS